MANVLILCNDAIRVKVKTCEALANACRALGHSCLVRDTADVRFALETLQTAPAAAQTDFHEHIASKWIRLLNYYEIDTIIALDLDWLLLPREFLDSERIQNIHSLWFDDLKTSLHSHWNHYFPHPRLDIQAILTHPKVTHYFYSHGQLEEARLLGLNNAHYSALAADETLLHHQNPPEITNRIAFIGNPGYRQTPHPAIVDLMHKGAELHELRALSRQHILAQPPPEFQDWYQEEPSVRKLIENATEIKALHPYQPAARILLSLKKDHPSAITYLKEKGHLLSALRLIKLVNHYERPATVYRLYHRGFLDVYSAPEEWEPYGIVSNAFLSAPQLAPAYQRYLLHLNAANPIRDATANEKLFEIAASARASLNLESPDVRKCYSDDHILFAASLEELEYKANHFRSSPESATRLGQNARLKTQKDHLWQNRLESILVQKTTQIKKE